MGVEAQSCFVCPGNDVVVVVRSSGLPCRAEDWVRFDYLHSLPVDVVNGHCLDEMRAIRLFPNRNDD